MRPTPEAALRGIQRNLLEVVLPAISETYVRGQVEMMATYLGILADGWSTQGARQAAAIARMRSFVDRASGSDALASPDGSLPPAETLDELQSREDEAMEALAQALVALEERGAPTPAEQQLRADIYGFLRDYLQA